ncbi:MAG: hypothetical protein JXB25_06725, partial [Deltaproteobacteria bacterium]|nr:hypothetical protein [Deltaproteobacteria bacterium]
MDDRDRAASILLPPERGRHGENPDGSAIPAQLEGDEELLSRIARPEDVEIRVRPAADGRWLLTIAGADQRGLLSLVAGLLTASGIVILYGRMTTRRGRATQPGSPGLVKILDLFEVETQEAADNAAFWPSFAAELKALAGKAAHGELDNARQGIIDRICAVMKRHQSPAKTLLPVSIRFDNDSSETMTVLHLHSEDTPGFLFSFANALAMLEINIESAEVVTSGGEVRDTFWVQDLGRRKITSPEKLQQLRAACALIKQFTYLLPRSANPGLALRQFGDLVNQMLFQPEWVHDLGSIRSHRVLNNIAALMGVSRFLWEDFLRMQYENLFPMISDPTLLEKSLGREDFLAELGAELEAVSGDEERVAVLNSFKDRHMFRIDLQHITHHIGDIRFSTELSELAEVVVEQMALLC